MPPGKFSMVFVQRLMAVEVTSKSPTGSFEAQEASRTPAEFKAFPFSKFVSFFLLSPQKTKKLLHGEVLVAVRILHRQNLNSQREFLWFVIGFLHRRSAFSLKSTKNLSEILKSSLCMSAHHEECLQVYNVTQRKCFFFLEKSRHLCMQKSFKDT